jgi:CheY-like chemotaxis protein
VTVASAEGKGTSFEVFLPAAEAGAEDEPSGEEPLVRGGTELVLVAEDEPAVRRLTRTVLERHGYRVLEAANGEEAIGLWRDHGRSVDLLLTDLVMPAGVSGRELASRLRADRPGLKVIYFSGYSDEIGGRELVLDGGERFLQKPFAASVLLETVRGCLD